MYGFEVSNNLGEVVISSETPVYHFSNQITVFPSDPNRFAVPRNSPKDLHFYQFPVGAEIGYAQYTSFTGDPTADAIRSNLSQLTIRIYRPIADYVAPSTSGYGLEVFDANGNLTFTSEKELLACDAGVVTGNGNTTDIGDSEWISPGMPVVYQQESGGVYSALTNLLKRSSQNSVRQKAVLLETAPFPFQLPFASPWDIGALWF